MSTFNSHNLGNLEASDRFRIDQMAEEVLQAQSADECLHKLLNNLDSEGSPRLVCALFESLFWRIDIKFYWIFYRVMICYRQLRQFEAAYLLGVLANKIDPASSGALLVSQVLFSHFMRSGARREALAVFDRYNDFRPEHPFVSEREIKPLLEEFGRETPGEVVSKKMLYRLGKISES